MLKTSRLGELAILAPGTGGELGKTAVEQQATEKTEKGPSCGPVDFEARVVRRRWTGIDGKDRGWTWF
jgi:hypothetical protein